MSNFDHTSRDFSSIQADLLRRAQDQIPEWTSREESDFGTMLVDLWAYMGDILHYYVDRAAGEAFLQTATQRESVLAIANLLDYVPAGRRAATATITLNAAATTATDTAPVYLPRYTRFLARPLVDNASPVVFTLNAPTAFVGSVSGASASLVRDGVTYNTYAKTSPVVVGVTEGEIFTETYTSTGTVGQKITLRNTGVVTESITVNVNEGPNGSAVSYSYIDRLIKATSSQRVFSVDVAADNSSILTFGNAVNGKIPTINSTISITYRRSRGGAGNVNAQAIYRLESTTVAGAPSLDGLVIVPNATPASGGIDIESISSLKANIPASFRSQDRAVSLQDYIDIVKRVPGIVKSTARVDNAGVVQIKAVETPSNYGSSNTLVLPANKVTAIQEFLEPREIVYVTSNVSASVTLTPIRFKANMKVMDGFIRETVVDNVEKAIKELFSFDAIDFHGSSISASVALGNVYRAAMAVEGVDYINVTAFTTTNSDVVDTIGTFVGVAPAQDSMLVVSTTSVFEFTTVSGGIVATGT